LKALLEDGIIIPAYLQEQIVMAKRKEILSSHPYKVFYASDNRWATYLCGDGKRRLVKRKELKDLEDAIIKFYEEKEAMTFIDIYHKFREYHDKLVSDNTDEERYFKDRAFSLMNVKLITSDDVSVFIRRTIEDLGLCQSAAKTLFLYVNNAFEFALRHDIISKSPTRLLNAKDFYKYTYPSLRSKKPKVISDEELSELQVRYTKDLNERPDSIPIYAVILSSLTGMRVGEIAALTWDNVFDDYILVDKSQKYNPKTRQYYIHRTKNSKVRRFPVTGDIRKLLLDVRSVEEAKGYVTNFIFSDKNGPVNFRKISSCMKNKCRQVGIETYGIHAYRRTINSVMARDGVSTSIRAALLGHSREVNEKYYTYDVSSIADKAMAIEMANKSMAKK